MIVDRYLVKKNNTQNTTEKEETQNSVNSNLPIDNVVVDSLSTVNTDVFDGETLYNNIYITIF